jgi:hypothetical protein
MKNLLYHIYAAVTINPDLDVVSIDPDSCCDTFEEAEKHICRDDMTVASITIILPEDYL